jgi:hypothetical protein
VLGIHSRRVIEDIHRDALKGLNSLHTLDFSDCSSSDITGLVGALLAYPGTLEFLKLDQIGGRSVTIDGNFVNMVAVKKISKLSLCGTNIFPMGPITATEKEPTLNYIDISNSTILPSKSYNFNDRYILLTNILRNVEVLNVSSLPYSFLNIDYTLVRKVSGKNCLQMFSESSSGEMNNYLFPNMKVLEINDLFKYKIVLNNSVINLTCAGQVNLKSISMRHNNLQWMNISLLLPTDFAIKEMDLSSNKIQYLSPQLMSGFSYLQRLNLAYNSLGFMQKYEEFSNIFSGQRHIIVLNMAFNSLT